MVGKLAKKVRRPHPGIEFQLSSSNFALPAMDRVMRGAMEVGLGRWIFIPEALESRTVANERLVVALHEGHRLSRRTSLVMADLAGEPFCHSPRASRRHPARLSSPTVQQRGYAPDIVQVAPDSQTLMALVAAEIGVALTVSSVPENFSHPGVVFPAAG